MKQYEYLCCGSIPVLRYLKDPVSKIEDLYIRYPQGGEPGWFAIVFNEKTFAYWNVLSEKWDYLSLSNTEFNNIINKLGEKADSDNVYTKIEIDQKLSLRASFNNIESRSIVVENDLGTHFRNALATPVNGGKIETFFLTDDDFDWNIIPYKISGSDIVISIDDVLNDMPVIHYDYYFMTYKDNPNISSEVGTFAGEGYLSPGVLSDEINGRHIGVPKYGGDKISLSYEPNSKYALKMRIKNVAPLYRIHQSIFRFEVKM